jgi:hypothetical protein
VAGFSPSLNATLSVLRKLDHCFTSLLLGRDLKTQEPLPGFENVRAGMSKTDMVRCKSTIEQTRIIVIEVVENRPEEEEEEQEDGDTDMDTDRDESSAAKMAGLLWEEDEDRLHMDVARVYENTLVTLGETLGQGPGPPGEIRISDD